MIDNLFDSEPYGLKQEEKERVLLPILTELTNRHIKLCDSYARIIEKLPFFSSGGYKSLNDIPFIPVRLFKELKLISSSEEKIVKTLTSSGTSGQKVSKIYLDATNVRNQSKVLNRIIGSYIGPKRLPLLLLDSEMIKKDRSSYSARGAGIVGFSLFGRDITYALDDHMILDQKRIKDFLDRNVGKRILLFGYTYMIWQYVVKELEQNGVKYDLKDAILFHIGGWKKLKDQAVSSEIFNQKLKEVFGPQIQIYNYYGMAEQLGSVFVECEYGHMHCSIFSDVIIRDSVNYRELGVGEKGLLELLSVLPTSYPGHSILTEDEGVLLGVDDCACGRKGKYFKILGRVKNSEIRGCSDTFERN